MPLLDKINKWNEWLMMSDDFPSSKDTWHMHIWLQFVMHNLSPYIFIFFIILILIYNKSRY
jgi:hypothetical protein